MYESGPVRLYGMVQDRFVFSWTSRIGGSTNPHDPTRSVSNLTAVAARTTTSCCAQDCAHQETTPANSNRLASVIHRHINLMPLDGDIDSPSPSRVPAHRSDPWDQPIGFSDFMGLIRVRPSGEGCTRAGLRLVDTSSGSEAVQNNSLNHPVGTHQGNEDRSGKGHELSIAIGVPQLNRGQES